MKGFVIFASLALVLIFGIHDTNATLACDNNAQCASISLNPEFAICDKSVSLPGNTKAGVCRCLVERGFSGAASTISKCFCNAPSQVYYKNVATPGSNDKLAYCTVIDKALMYDNEKAAAEFYESQTLKIYNSLVWPTPALIVQELMQGKQDGIMSTIFAHDAKGRVDPAGEFIGYEGIIEYFYGEYTFFLFVVNILTRRFYLDTMGKSRQSHSHQDYHGRSYVHHPNQSRIRTI